MASSYQKIAWTYETTAGTFTPLPVSISVKARIQGAGADVAESPLTTNANGEIVAGSFAAVAVGTIVNFRVENYNGMAFSVAQTTT